MLSGEMQGLRRQAVSHGLFGLVTGRRPDVWQLVNVEVDGLPWVSQLQREPSTATGGMGCLRLASISASLAGLGATVGPLRAAAPAPGGSDPSQLPTARPGWKRVSGGRRERTSSA